MTGGDRSSTQEIKKGVNKSSKRENLIKDVISDVKLNKQKHVNGHHYSRFAINKRGPKRTTKSIQVTPTKLLGHYETDIDGKNLVMDEPSGIRVYCLPIEIKELEQRFTGSIQLEDSVEEAVIDDWELLAEDPPITSHLTSAPKTDVIIPDCNDLKFNLLKGYVATKDGGNSVGFAGRIRDRTACMRWMVKNHLKIKCDDKSRLFNVDFMMGNGVARRVMTSEFDHYAEEVHLAVILLKGTYYIWDVNSSKVDDELNNKRSFAGLRFEDFTSRGIDGSENEPSIGEKNNYNDAIKYYNVVALKFGTHQLLIAGEVDCVIPESAAALGKKPKVHDFIELKTSAPLEDRFNPSQKSRLFRSGKTISWFAQCILMGMKHVVVGIREEDGDEMTCTKTRSFTLEELRQHSDGSWSKNRCFDALNKFLFLVKEKVTEDNSESINIFMIKEGVITDPVKKTVADDENLPDISEVVDLFEKLQQQI